MFRYISDLKRYVVKPVTQSQELFKLLTADYEDLAAPCLGSRSWDRRLGNQAQSTVTICVISTLCPVLITTTATIKDKEKYNYDQSGTIL